jgi:hypothetical protein
VTLSCDKVHSIGSEPNLSYQNLPQKVAVIFKRIELNKNEILNYIPKGEIKDNGEGFLILYKILRR